ncbi:pirin family protein [Pedobacter sp.]|jgi:redox-sensitive bicupin YhaK (pirin superfamily)|uniref:pirin family protein n=1 Tax=Pedobacter sp. TaxID=1411316 RepID=UPI002CB02800|nr:pirin family protein [Pedobacter sp.]HWW42791.1 pirin family protein [Pedobacter sp.]
MKTTIKSVAAVLNAPAPHMVGDGFRVHNFFPGGYKINMSPFYLLDYNAKIDFSARNEPRGVGVHPHRGFETVTIAYHGAVAHHDSAGNSGVIYPGDVQWMTAASGILHKEYHEETYSKSGGPFQMVQLWVNLPSQYKMTRPKYQALKHDEINRVNLPDHSGQIEVIAGNYQGIKGSASTFTPVHVYNARLNTGAKASFDFPAAYNTGFVVIEGKIRINQTETALANQFIHFGPEGEEIEIEALEPSVVLILSGEPIDEPVTAYGPFLMNTPEEIQQAISDYNQGKFGFLED